MFFIRMHFLISAKNWFFMEQTILGGNVSWNSESPTSTLSAWKWVFHLLDQVGWECLLWNWKYIMLGKYLFCLLFCNHVPGLQCKNDFFQYLQVIFSHHSLNPIYFPTIFSFSQSCSWFDSWVTSYLHSKVHVLTKLTTPNTGNHLPLLTTKMPWWQGYCFMAPFWRKCPQCHSIDTDIDVSVHLLEAYFFPLLSPEHQSLGSNCCDFYD